MVNAEFPYTASNMSRICVVILPFEKQIFNDNSISDFFHHRKTARIDSLKQLLNNYCASKITEILVSTFQRMRKNSLPRLLTSTAIFMLRSETLQTTLVIVIYEIKVYLEPFLRDNITCNP